MPPETATVPCHKPPYKNEAVDFESYNENLIRYVDKLFSALEVCAGKVDAIREWYDKQPL